MNIGVSFDRYMSGVEDVGVVRRKTPSAFTVDPAVRQAIAWRSRWTLRLLKRYSGRWIAIRGRQVVAAARTYEELQDRLDVLRPGAVYVSREETPVLVVY